MRMLISSIKKKKKKLIKQYISHEYVLFWKWERCEHDCVSVILLLFHSSINKFKFSNLHFSHNTTIYFVFMFFV